MRAAQFRGDGSRVVGRQVIDGRVTARVRVVRRVVDDTEHEQVHQTKVQQQEAATERQETQTVVRGSECTTAIEQTTRRLLPAGLAGHGGHGSVQHDPVRSRSLSAVSVTAFGYLW
jgi:hypothetical protein